MSKCHKHGCALTETITDEVFCGVCRTHELKIVIEQQAATIEALESYAGHSRFFSDFKSADDIRNALKCQGFLAERLKTVVITNMVSTGWTLEAATQYINDEFSVAKAAEAIELLRKLNEDKTNNAPADGS